jgi:hypothetical protein
MSTPRDSFAESIRQITPGESLSSEPIVDKKRLKKALKKAIENLSWNESYFIKTTRLKGGKYNEVSRTKRLFDKFCWLYTLLFFLREPNVSTFERYMEIFASHVTHEIPDSSNNFDNLTDIQVCNRRYFMEYFCSSSQDRRGAKHKVKEGLKGMSRGFYLYKHYRFIRNEVFLECERIFWIPSF